MIGTIIEAILRVIGGTVKPRGYDRSRRDFTLPSNYQQHTPGISVWDQNKLVQNREGNWEKKIPEKRRRGPEFYRPETHGYE
jgi:hypothetical protein